MLLLTWFRSAAWEGGEESKVMTFYDQSIPASLLPLHMQTPGPVIQSGCRTSSLSLSALSTGKGKVSSMLFLALFDLVPTGLLFVTHLCMWARCFMTCECALHPEGTASHTRAPPCSVQSWGHCSLAEAVPWSLAPTSVEAEHPGSVIPAD